MLLYETMFWILGFWVVGDIIGLGTTSKKKSKKWDFDPTAKYQNKIPI